MKRKFKSVLVKFKNDKFNYITSINPNVLDKDIRKYFVGNIFNIGIYPKENIQIPIDVEITTK